MNKIINGNCLDVLKEQPDNSVDLVVTDPPYGYSFMGKDWDTFNEVVEPQGAYQNEKGFKKLPRNKVGKDFMVFFVPIWKECIRVLKPGGFAFVMSAPRQDTLHKQIEALEQAGFDMGFTSIYWTYASGFPKAMNLGKAADRKLGNDREVVGRNPNSRENCDKTNTIYESGTVGKTDHITKGSSPLEGSYGGFQPKPAVEVIIVAMKPIEDTYVAQALSRVDEEEQILKEIRKNTE